MNDMNLQSLSKSELWELWYNLRADKVDSLRDYILNLIASKSSGENDREESMRALNLIERGA